MCNSTAKKHIVLVCNCKPYGLPVTEAVGQNNIYRGLTAEQLAAFMSENGIHLSIFSPRKIPGLSYTRKALYFFSKKNKFCVNISLLVLYFFAALINLFERAGGESSLQKTYSRDPRHLVLLNGFHLQVRIVLTSIRFSFTIAIPYPKMNDFHFLRNGQLHPRKLPR